MSHPTNHDIFMKRALQLAVLGKATVSPNPMVGAVLVCEGKIIAEGFHKKYGTAHAEADCLANVPESDRYLLADSTLYVSLEPCNHFGNTPPCTDLIINSGIKNVVVACMDPYEKVNGSGIKKLQDAGIIVTKSVLEKEAVGLNSRFFTFHRKQRPYIILKWAQTKDGFIGKDKERIKISSQITDRLVHTWRSEEASILVGTKTAIDDNPLLTTRLVKGRNPVRLIIDKELRISANHHLLADDLPTIIINTIKQREEGVKTFYKVGRDENILAVILNLLHQRKLISLLVEGGRDTLQRFIDAGIWDEARIITNNTIYQGGGIHAPVLKGSRMIHSENYLTETIDYLTNAAG